MRALALLLLVALSSCGGGDGTPTVAGSNLVPVSISMQVPGQTAAAIGRVGPALALPGVKSVRITISGPGFAPIVDVFNATPGLAVTRNFQVPQGTGISFTIEAFNGPLGAGAVTFTGTTVVTVAPQGVGAPALAINIIVTPTPAADLIAPVVVPPAAITVAAPNAQGAPATDPAIVAFLAGATATDNVLLVGVVSNNAPAVFPLGATTVIFSATDDSANTGTATSVVTVSARVGLAHAYIEGVSAPFGSQTRVNAMDAAFGVNNWTQLTMAVNGVSPFLLNSGFGFIFLDGTDGNALELAAYLQANQAQIESWVSAGGHLWVNSAPNQGGNIPLGFGGVLLTNGIFSRTATAFNPQHAIFAGPNPVAATGYSGNFFSHAALSGGAITSIMVDGALGNDVLIAEKVFGAGLVVFGTMTDVIFQQPAPDSANLWANILSYTAGPIVADGIPPVVTPPANITIEATGATTAVALGTATVTDNVDVGLSATPNNTGPFPVGVTTVTWSATDAAGNTGTAAQTVTVTDLTAPVVTAPAPITINSNVAVPVANANIQTFLAAAAANDLVDGAIVPSNDAPTSFPVGVTTTVTFSATDAANNTGTATSTVTVADLTAPIVVAQNPANGATGVIVNSAISAHFSEPMNTASVNTGNFIVNVTAGAAVTGTLSFDVTGTNATFVPTGNLLANTNYTVTLTTAGMTDVAGNAIVTAVAPLSFTTGASVISLPAVLPVVQGAITNLGNYDGFSMLWSGLLNGGNQANRWTGVLANPTTTVTGIESFLDGAVVATVTGGALPAKIADNRIIQIGALNSGDNLAASVSLDGQFIAATNLDVGLQTVEQMLFVKTRVPIHTAATVAGVYNMVEFTRIPGATFNSTSTSNGVLTVNANSTWSFAATGTSINPITLQLGAPFAIADNGTFIIDVNGTGITSSAISPNMFLRTLVSADGNYIVVFRMDSVTRESGVMVGVRQHATTINVANTTATDVRFSLSEAVPVSGMTGDVGILTIDANGLLNDTHASRIETGVELCGVGAPPNQPNCQVQVGLATTITGGANGAITGVDSTGTTIFTGFASQNGNVIISEDPGRGIDVVIQQ
ncbi:MAG: Ig-like domain-containing protein [Mariprofundus sp.]|nr:Ig-like domain-containing protein [Mariprofundus sp.]